MKKMMAMLLASVMVAGTFATTAFAYTGDDVQKNTSVSTAAQEADAAGSANAGKTDNTDSIEIDPDMQGKRTIPTASKSTRTCRCCRMAMKSLRMRMGT